jgi:hypothetical protein
MPQLNFQEASALTLLAQLSPEDPRTETLLNTIEPERREGILAAVPEIRGALASRSRP